MWQMLDSRPEFIPHDPVGWASMGRVVAESPEYVLVGTDADGAVVAWAFSVPFVPNTEGRGVSGRTFTALRENARTHGFGEVVAPASMTVSGSLAQWREWTGPAFDADGYAVYVESNVWVRHRL